MVCVLTFKFFMWNYWKVEQAWSQAKDILKAPPAVNLELREENILLFQKSFAYNPRGNFYLINHFDIAPYIGDKLELTMTVNKVNPGSLLLYRFKRFNIIVIKDYYFVFFIQSIEIEEFVKLRDSMLLVFKSLPGLANKGENALEENITGDFIEVKALRDSGSE